MLPPLQRVLFVLFAALTGTWSARGFLRLYRRIRRGRGDTDDRFSHMPSRLWYALATTLTQSRTFRKRPVVSTLHSFIFYGFVLYLLVNLVDAVDGFVPLSFPSPGVAGHMYVLFADVFSALVLFAVIALVLRRFILPGRRDFRFNGRTLLHPAVKRRYITTDSIIVSAFILFHVGSRAVGAGAKIAMQGRDPFAPFATLLSHLFTPQDALAWRIFGYWGALGSVLAFLAYFPYSKHVHIFMAPAKYLFRRPVSSGVLPALTLDTEDSSLGAKTLEELAWPRLLDAYACIQCNRCQDVCPATATGKSLSPSALEINKRMELNELSRREPAFERGAPSPHPLLSFALTPEAAWACTTCGACIEVCPVGDEPMLDIMDVRREQVMMDGTFPTQLQSAFRGMERAQNPWGLNAAKRMDWAEGLPVKTIEQNPDADVLYWVGCAASYDPQAQKTARAFVQLLDRAGVSFAVLGKRECCTGDSARRAGNEYLYRQLAESNVATLNALRPKRIVATCPHCMNSLGNEYKQLGGDYDVVHHTQLLQSLVAEGKLSAGTGSTSVAFHDPCYLGRHNGVYDAPRNLLHVLSNSVVEMPRHRENAFCCGAGGAQFWKEEEAGDQRVSDNRYQEAQRTLAGSQDAVLAVGCPFCKSMLESTPAKGETPLPVRDVAELLLEAVQRKSGIVAEPAGLSQVVEHAQAFAANEMDRAAPEPSAAPFPSIEELPRSPLSGSAEQPAAPARKAWKPKQRVSDPPDQSAALPDRTMSRESGVADAPTQHFPYIPATNAQPTPEPAPRDAADSGAPKRKTWAPKNSS